MNITADKNENCAIELIEDETKDLLTDNVLFFLLDKERVKFVEFVLEQAHEMDLFPRHGRLAFAGGGALVGYSRALGRSVNKFQLLLQILVRQKLFAPLGQGLLYLIAQALPELHLVFVYSN